MNRNSYELSKYRLEKAKEVKLIDKLLMQGFSWKQQKLTL